VLRPTALPRPAASLSCWRY